MDERGYDVKFETFEQDLEFDFSAVLSISGTIVYGEENDVEKVGSLSLQLIDICHLGKQGSGLFEVFDCLSAQHEEFFEDVIFRRLKFWQAIDKDKHKKIMFLEDVSIDPKHRGKRLGLAAVLRAIEAFGTGCMVILKPMPLGTESDQTKGIKKLRKYWSQVGFQRIGRTDYFYFDTLDRISSDRSIVRLSKRVMSGRPPAPRMNFSNPKALRQFGIKSISTRKQALPRTIHLS